MTDLRNLPLTLAVSPDYLERIIRSLPDEHQVTTSIDVTLDVQGYVIDDTFETEVEIDLAEEVRDHLEYTHSTPCAEAKYTIKDVRHAWCVGNARSTKDWVIAVLDEGVTQLLEEAMAAQRLTTQNLCEERHRNEINSLQARLDKKQGVIKTLQQALNEQG